MTDDEHNQEALFRHAILGDLLSRNLRRGELCLALKQLAQQTYQDHHGRTRRVAYKTLEEWYYKYRKGGFAALQPRPRKDRHTSRVFSQELQQLIVDMKREDPGRSARLIVRELELAGRIRLGQVSRSSVERLLRRHGLSVPRMEWDRSARYRREAATCGELWQADALHGPVLMNLATGRKQRVIVFGLLDDRSRLIPYLEGGFGETEPRFLAVLYQALARRPASAATICGCYAHGWGFTWYTAARRRSLQRQDREILENAGTCDHARRVQSASVDLGGGIPSPSAFLPLGPHAARSLGKRGRPDPLGRGSQPAGTAFLRGSRAAGAQRFHRAVAWCVL
jgi:transposase